MRETGGEMLQQLFSARFFCRRGYDYFILAAFKKGRKGKELRCLFVFTELIGFGCRQDSGYVVLPEKLQGLQFYFSRIPPDIHQ